MHIAPLSPWVDLDIVSFLLVFGSAAGFCYSFYLQLEISFEGEANSIKITRTVCHVIGHEQMPNTRWKIAIVPVPL